MLVRLPEMVKVFGRNLMKLCDPGQKHFLHRWVVQAVCVYSKVHVGK